MALLKESERICRELGNSEGLQRALNNQASILYYRGNSEDAMALLKEQEKLRRKLGNVEGLATSLVNQASLLRRMNRAFEGLPLADEAYRLATTNGYATLSKQIEMFLNAVRRGVQGASR
jgi:hypothetical protein